MLDETPPGTNNKIEGFVHFPKQEKETKTMPPTLPVAPVTGASSGAGSLQERIGYKISTSKSSPVFTERAFLIFLEAISSILFSG